MRTLKEDHVTLSKYKDFWDARAQIDEFIEEVYQKKRVHSSLGYLPPAVFEERWYRQQRETAAIQNRQPETVQPNVRDSDR